MLRARVLLSLLLLPTLLACDKADDKQAKADDKAKAADKSEVKPEEKPVEKPKEKKLEHPWAVDALADVLKPGTKLTYKQTGKGADGKDVEDDYACVVKTATARDVGTVCNGVNHPSKDKGANEVATVDWSAYSPFFALSQPEAELVERADLTVPAGTFDTVQVKAKDFFGNSYTFWMIADKPGIYAKVHKHANVNTEDDKTDMVFELASIE
jgi:hypothetical protein